MDDSFRIYRPRALPHWRLNGATYFVTWDLATGQQRLSEAERQTVAESIASFNGARYELQAYVVMDDHAHVVVYPLPGWSLQRLVHDWKSYTAHLLAKAERQSPIWQKDYYDRIIRDEAELREKVAYVVGNPQKRWPGSVEYPWVYPKCEGG